MEADQKFLEEVVKAVVDNPQDVEVDRKVDEMGELLTLKVHAEAYNCTGTWTAQKG